MHLRYVVLAMKQETHHRLENRNAEEFAEEERQGIMLAARVRLIALVLVLAWVAYDSPATGIKFYTNLLEISVFIVLGGLQYWSARSRFHTLALAYLFVAIDCLYMAVIFSTGLRFDETGLAPAIAMDSARFLYFFMFLMQCLFNVKSNTFLLLSSNLNPSSVHFLNAS